MIDPTDLRGHMHRANRLLPDEEARAFLRTQKVAHVATVGVDGWPYVVPLIYIYEGGQRLFVQPWCTSIAEWNGRGLLASLPIILELPGFANAK